jgi:thiamine pyrophosphokinase
MDSLPTELKLRYSSIIQHYSEQETNDLTKSVRFCISRSWTKLTILGATGKREDHTLGNLSLLTDYAETASVQALTDYGVFTPLLESAEMESFPRQQVSIFSMNPASALKTCGLVYHIDNRGLSSWWQGTLNEAITDSFSLKFDTGKVLIFREYPA